jgi:pyroglutamyl-peptidase
MEKILVTGFGPFGHNTSNPSSSSLETLGCGDDNIIICTNIEVSCKAVDNYLSSIDASNMRIHLGLNEDAKKFYIEQFAYNQKNFPIPDMDGLRPAGETIDVNGPNKQETSIDIHALLSHLVKMDFQVEISDDPGRYVCNYMYYKSLNKKRNAIFVHVPPYEVIDKSIQKQFITSLIDYVRYRYSS